MTTLPMTTLTQQIRSALSETHDRIEQLPAAVAMGSGSIPRSTYTHLLVQLLAVHSVLEPALAARPELAEVYRPDMDRAVILRADLRAFGVTDPPPTVPATDALVARIREWASGPPWPLVGALYVFEGSRMGSMILAKRLAVGFGVPAEPGHGLDYHLDGPADGAGGRMPAWQRFKAAVDALGESEETRSQILAAAIDTMNGVFAIYESAMPISTGAAPPG